MSLEYDCVSWEQMELRLLNCQYLFAATYLQNYQQYNLLFIS